MIGRDLLESIARKLARPIPKPYRKPPKKQASWRQLKPGQRLLSLEAITVGSQIWPPATRFEVIGTDSAGADLKVLDECGQDVAGAPTLRWVIKEWDQWFKRIKR